MKKIISNTIKKISNKEISVKKNYKLFRILDDLTNPTIFNRNKYKDFTFNLEDRSIRSRFFYPQKDNKGIIIYIHGGGWVFGSVESYTNLCIELAKITKRIVISIDYRLAPEHPYPNGLDDCYEVIKLIMNNLNDLGFNKKDVCLMGDSAGGNLVAAISIKSRLKKDFKIPKQVLIYPPLQSDYSKNTKYKSVTEKGKDFLLTQKQLQDYIDLYTNNSNDIYNPFISPLNVKFPYFQPDTLIITADNDPLRDEGKRYAKKLKFYFNRVEYYNIKDAMHGFLSNPLEKNNKKIAFEKIIEFLGDKNEKKN